MRQELAPRDRKWPLAANIGAKRADRTVASETTPLLQMPFFLEAAILSRMRSPVTSRSNWASFAMESSRGGPQEPNALWP
jgi:hypothetical protein